MEDVAVIKKYLLNNNFNETLKAFEDELVKKNKDIIITENLKLTDKKYILKDIVNIKNTKISKKDKKVYNNLKNNKIFRNILASFISMNKNKENNYYNNINILNSEIFDDNDNNTKDCFATKNNNISFNNIEASDDGNMFNINDNNNISFNNNENNISFSNNNNNIQKNNEDTNNLETKAFNEQTNINPFNNINNSFTNENKKCLSDFKYEYNNKSEFSEPNNDNNIFKSDILPAKQNKNKNKEANKFFNKVVTSVNDMSKTIKMLNTVPNRHAHYSYDIKDKLLNSSSKKSKVADGLVKNLVYDLPIYFCRNNSNYRMLANRYEIVSKITESTFCHTYIGMDLKNNSQVCLKIVKETKDDLDQSLLEIYILKLLKSKGKETTYSKYFMQVYDYFYYNVY